MQRLWYPRLLILLSNDGVLEENTQDGCDVEAAHLPLSSLSGREARPIICRRSVTG